MLFSVGRIGIGFYLGHTDAVTAFGAAGSLAVVLIWVYYSALAFFIGALVARYVQEGTERARPTTGGGFRDESGAGRPGPAEADRCGPLRSS